MFTYATQPQSIGKVLDNGIRLYVASFTNIILFATLAAFITNLPSFFAPPPPETVDAIDATQLMTQNMLPFLLSTLISFIFINAMLVRMHATARSRNISMGEALGIGVRKMLPVFIGMILYMIAIMLGIVLLVIPGLILMLSLSFYTLFIVLYDEKIIASLRNSHSLVWGNWWRTATVYLVPAVLFFVIYILGAMILGLSIPFTEDPGGEDTLDMAINVLVIIVSIFAMPLFYSVALALFNDLKLRKQGFDLEERISS